MANRVSTGRSHTGTGSTHTCSSCTGYYYNYYYNRTLVAVTIDQPELKQLLLQLNPNSSSSRSVGA